MCGLLCNDEQYCLALLGDCAHDGAYMYMYNGNFDTFGQNGGYISSERVYVYTYSNHLNQSVSAKHETGL